MARAAILAIVILAAGAVLAIAASAQYVEPPTCVVSPAEDIEVKLGSSGTVTLTCTSHGGPGPFTAALEERPDAGTAGVAPGAGAGVFVVTYTAPPVGTTTSARSMYISVQVSDGATVSAYVSFYVRLAVPPPAPECYTPNEEFVVAGVERAFTAACYLDDGSYPTYELVSRPGHGSFREDSPGIWLYRPTKGYRGSDSFSYRARNGEAVASTVVQRIRVIKPIPGVNTPSVDYCLPRAAGEQCGPGYGRRTRGGGEKVSHRNWPRVTGILWSVRDSANHTKKGGPLNDELLGHHGSDRLSGRGGIDILWGDWDPLDNNETQRDVLEGGAGGDFIYTSHGTNTVRAGAGADHVWAFYGRGTIDCGRGRDIVRVRKSSKAYKLRSCERRGKF